MTMLPDIDQQAWDDYERNNLATQIQQKISGFGLDRMIGDKIAGLQTVVGGGPQETPPAPEPPPIAPVKPDEPPEVTQARLQYQQQPEPPPRPEPPPSYQPTPEPEPAPLAPAAPSPAPAPAPEPAPSPIPSPSAASGGDWFGQVLGRVHQAGGDVQKFADSFSSGASDAVGSALGAASAAGANVQQFAQGLNAPPPPAPAPGLQSPGGVGPPGASVAGVPGWLVDLIGRNAPAELAADPDFIRTVAAGAKAESGWDVNRVQQGFRMGSGAGARGLFQFDMGGMGAGMNEDALLGQSGAEYQASKIVPLYARAYMSAPQGLSGAEKASWVAAQAERPLGYDTPTSAARRNYASAYSEIGAGPLERAGAAIGGAASALGTAVQGGLKQVSQFGDKQLSSDEAYAACGPAAAVRFAQMYGRNPSLREATDLAASVGWTSGAGMAGIGSEKALMDKLGVSTRMVGGDWNAIATEAQTGNPVTISTPGHYFFADGYDPNSGAFHVGQSGLDLKGGSEWMTPQQMEARMGKVQGALFADNPKVPAPSTAEKDTNPLTYLGRLKDTMVQRFTGTPEVQPDLSQPTVNPITGKLQATWDQATANLDQAVQSAAQPVRQAFEERGEDWGNIARRVGGINEQIMATEPGAPAQGMLQGVQGRLGEVLPKTWEDYTGRFQVPEEAPGIVQAVGGAASKLGTTAKIAQDVLNEISPATGGARLVAGQENLLWSDPEYRALMGQLGIDESTTEGQRAARLVTLGPGEQDITRQINQRRQELLSGLTPGDLSAAAWQSPERREDLETRYNIAAGALSMLAAPQGLASGVPRFAASVALDPSNAVFGAPEIAGALRSRFGAQGAEDLIRTLPAEDLRRLTSGAANMPAGTVLGPGNQPWEQAARLLENAPPERTPFGRGGLGTPDYGYAPGSTESVVGQTLRDAASAASDGVARLTGEEVGRLPGMPTRAPGTPKWQQGTSQSLDDVRYAIDHGIDQSRWYTDFARNAARLVGPENINEFRTLFGITSQQTAPNDNLAYSLGFMRMAREFQENGTQFTVANMKKFMKDNPINLGTTEGWTDKQIASWLKGSKGNGSVVDGQRYGGWGVGGKQLEKIRDLYTTGQVKVGSNAKTSSYSQNILSALRNRFDPNSTMDTWIAQLFNYNNTKEVANNDTAYRSMRAVFDHLSGELGLVPHQAQAAAWFAIKGAKDFARTRAASPEYKALVKSFEQGTGATLRQVIDMGKQEGAYDNLLGTWEHTIGSPQVADQISRLSGSLGKARPAIADNAYLYYPGKGTPKFGVDPMLTAGRRAVAEAGAPTITSDLSEQALQRLAYNDATQQFEAFGSIPHSVQINGDQVQVQVPGANLDSLQYLGAVLNRAGDQASMDVHIFRPESADLAGWNVIDPQFGALDPETVGTITRALDDAGIRYSQPAEDIIRVHALPQGSAEYEQRVADAVSGLGLQVEELNGVAQTVGAENFDPIIARFGSRYGGAGLEGLRDGGGLAGRLGETPAADSVGGTIARAADAAGLRGAPDLGVRSVSPEEAQQLIGGAGAPGGRVTARAQDLPEPEGGRLIRLGEEAQPSGFAQLVSPAGNLLSTVAHGGLRTPGRPAWNDVAGISRTLAGAEPWTLNPPSEEALKAFPNLMHMANDMPDVRASIQRIAEDNPGLIGKYTGKVSWEDTKDLASKLGMTAEDFLKSKPGQAFTPQEQLALRAAIVDKHDQIGEMTRYIKQNHDGDAAKMNSEEKLGAVRLMLEAAQLQAVGKGGASTIARALNQQKINVDRAIASMLTRGNELRRANRELTKAKARQAYANARLQNPLPESAAGRGLTEAERESIRQAGAPQRAQAKEAGSLYDQWIKLYKDELNAQNAYDQKTWDAELARLDKEAERRGWNMFNRKAAQPKDAELAWLQAEARNAARDAERENQMQARAWNRQLAEGETRKNMAGRILERIGPEDITNDMINHMVKIMESDDPMAAAKYLQSLQKVSWWDRLATMRYASMLSSTVTHGAQLVSNTGQLGMALATHPMSVGFDIAAQKLRGGERSRYMSELPAMLRGIVGKSPDELADSPYMVRGAMGGIRQGAQDAAEIMRSGLNPGEISRNWEQVGRPGFGFEQTALGRRMGARAAGAANFIAEGPLRSLEAGDSLIRGAARGAFAHGLAERQAIREGFSGAAKRQRVDEIIQNFDEFPELFGDADDAAKRVVLQEQRPGGLAAGLMSARRGPEGLAMSMVMPFIRTPWNVAAQGAGMTPLGYLSAAKAAHAGERGEAVDRMARATLGTGILGTAAVLGANNFLTGGYPIDPSERSSLEPNWQPYALRIPDGQGGARFTKYSNLGPVGVPLAAGAILGQAYKDAQKKGEQGLPIDPGSVVARMGAGMGRYMIDQTMLQGIANVIDAVTDPERKGEKVMQGLVTQFAPYAALGRQLDRALGTGPRDPREGSQGLLDAVLASYPGLSGNVPAKLDPLGREVQETQTGLSAFLSPARTTVSPYDPMTEALRNADVGVAGPPKSWRNFAMTEDERRMYQQQGGYYIDQMLNQILADPEFASLPIEARQSILQRAIANARNAGGADVMGRLGEDELMQRYALEQQRTAAVPR